MEGFSGHGLACRRGDRLLFGTLDFVLEPGGALVVSGPNGSGKTSLLRLMAGLARPAAGEIRWKGAPLGDIREDFHAAMAYVGHRDAVNPALTAIENLAFHAELKTPGRVTAERLEDALDRTGLLAAAAMPAALLSAGQSRRLALARVLASPARLWILDEPAATLDAASTAALAATVAEHCSDGGMAVVSTNVPFDLPGAGGLDMGGGGNPPADP